MKKFLLKSFLFSALLFGIAISRWLYIGTNSPENPILKRKIECINKDLKINTVFVGSSKINNQVIPKVIDSVAVGIHSFNLGANGSFNLENFETIDYFLKHKPPHLNIIVLELQNKFSFNRININAPRSYQVLSPSNFSFLMKYFYESKDYRQLAYTMYSFFLDIFDFNVGITKEEQNNDPFKEQGFFALDDEKNEDVVKRRKELINKPGEISRRIEAFKNDKKNYEANEALQNKIMSLKEDCLKRGVQLILLYPAPAEPDAKKLVAFEKNSPVPVINLVDPVEYPQFYNLKSRWDYGHLNRKGAEEHSRLIGAELLKLMDSKQISID